MSVLANFNNPCVDSLHIFIDGHTTATSLPVEVRNAGERVRIVELKQQPTYADLALYANKHMPGQVAVVMNGDCVFTHSVKYFTKWSQARCMGCPNDSPQRLAYADCEDKLFCDVVARVEI